jgi:hypothetical protein
MRKELEMPSEDLVKRIINKYGAKIDIGETPEILDDLLQEVWAPPAAVEAASPFGVSWMDSWMSFWVFAERTRTTERRNEAVATTMRALADLKFEERLHEIRDFIERRKRMFGQTPDGGPPEPGTPPAGPSAFAPPDGGPPEPGTPPAGPSVFAPPDGGPPEPGVPPTGPEPPAGPEGGFHVSRENPWILYWFLSIKAPMLLDVIDIHLTRRLEEMMRE